MRYYKVNYIISQTEFQGKRLKYPIQDVKGNDNLWEIENKEELDKEIALKRMFLEQIGATISDVVIEELTVDKYIELALDKIKKDAVYINAMMLQMSDSELKNVADDKGFIANSLGTLLEITSKIMNEKKSAQYKKVLENETYNQ